ncbi:tropomyosin, putative [Perkinsus marinus ATCC 50983]|uniref:Tropomyosin, putative n=1 Tax=Perkinsus marinus (strain ATCC 50983 / TXsc) TaxID=423536 RepID=C5KNH5_PERM5|nr:tropomyosin, putative [Perkinsus marinus ATCC 50983]EER13990.1 tropomyosin, putative [Perkinsus marinus ATCC 50983]|eukprot:XP_002782195.1 tropomyosin, putative [Perkinsus marinus ATCC 50983]
MRDHVVAIITAHHQEQKQARHEAAVRCLKAEHQTEAKTLRDEMQKARRTLESRVEEAQESKKKKEDELNRKLDEAKHALLEQDRKINIQGQEITEKNLALDHLSSRLAHETAILRKQLEREVEEHRQKMQLASERQRGEIRALTNEHKQVIEDRDKLAQQVEEGYTEKIIGLDNRIGELIRMYENRPSRDEDVIKIDHLEKELRQMNHAYEDLKERMKVYKLELINREQNYNKPIKGFASYSGLSWWKCCPTEAGKEIRQRPPQDAWQKGGNHRCLRLRL